MFGYWSQTWCRQHEYRMDIFCCWMMCLHPQCWPTLRHSLLPPAKSTYGLFWHFCHVHYFLSRQFTNVFVTWNCKLSIDSPLSAAAVRVWTKEQPQWWWRSLHQDHLVSQSLDHHQTGQALEHQRLSDAPTCQGSLSITTHKHGRIIHEAEASRPAPIGARTTWYNENLQSRTTLGPKISREKTSH